MDTLCLDRITCRRSRFRVKVVHHALPDASILFGRDSFVPN